jgi:pimeloyl-ACP methyl ester carboxylesterase
MAFLNRDGVNIYYEQRGKGPAVLLSHGYSASARMWAGQMDALSDRYHFIAWDMRGHDRSDSPDNPALYSHEATVADMAAILDACGVKRAIIGGLSLGGFMSLAFNLAHPARVAALMLFDTGPGYKKAGPRDEWNKMTGTMAKALETKGLAAVGVSAEGHRRAASQRARPRACGARDARAIRWTRHRVAAVDQGADAGAGRRQRRAVPRRDRLHGGENSRRRESHPRRRRPRRQYRPAGGFQQSGASVPRSRDRVAIDFTPHGALRFYSAASRNGRHPSEIFQPSALRRIVQHLSGSRIDVHLRPLSTESHLPWSRCQTRHDALITSKHPIRWVVKTP